MATFKLTPPLIAALPPNGKQQDIWDELIPGFGLRVGTSGRKVFFVRYRFGGTNRRLNLGRHPLLKLAEAREKARNALNAVAAGQDPAAERTLIRSTDTTFRALVDEVLAAKARETRPRTVKERARLARVELLPAWKDRPASSITRRDIVLLLERTADRAPTLANRTLSLIQLLFNEGLRRGFPTLESNPAHMLRKPTVENGRDRFLDRAELPFIWRSAEPEFLTTRGVLRFALLTAQRIGACKALRWTDIEAGNVWRTPAMVFKGKRDHLVPLSAEALAVIETVRPLTGDGEYVFPGRSGGPRVSTNKAIERMRERAKLPTWSPHDFRTSFRTIATRAAEDGGLGIDPRVADHVLGHKETSLGFGRYTGEQDRYLLAEKREALARWGAFVAAVVAS